MTDLQAAHARAVTAITHAIPDADEEQVLEVLDAVTGLVLETIKAFLPEGEETCN